ncbi:polyphosphate polymerase domain-containing protein [Streptococcus oralis]|uniref:VTC domain-containing protein n=1 Tax=Streptococcus oralis TaxID=1303 RepID=A0A139NVT2_STROR|nr:polyphosphate polymerase domain-containing protein [Streptococcus oralis]KXT79991.1 hypothetical protein SORDD15_01769 [Streptococcus oralis]
MKPLETTFKRIETKYLVSKSDVDALIKDLKEYLVEDDYPISTISNIYFDTEDFQLIQDSLMGNFRKEKIRMRSYLDQPTVDSPAFLEVKSKDENGIGHKYRTLSTPTSITQLLTHGLEDETMTDYSLLEQVHELRQRYHQPLTSRMYIYYDRFSLKEKRERGILPYQKIRVTLDQNLTYRDQNVSFFAGKDGAALLEDDAVIMEVKSLEQKPQWLQAILDKYGLVEQKFSKYSCAYHKSQGLAYRPRPVQKV